MKVRLTHNQIKYLLALVSVGAALAVASVPHLLRKANPPSKVRSQSSVVTNQPAPDEKSATSATLDVNGQTTALPDNGETTVESGGTRATVSTHSNAGSNGTSVKTTNNGNGSVSISVTSNNSNGGSSQTDFQSSTSAQISNHSSSQVFSNGNGTIQTNN